MKNKKFTKKMENQFEGIFYNSQNAQQVNSLPFQLVSFSKLKAYNITLKSITDYKLDFFWSGRRENYNYFLICDVKYDAFDFYKKWYYHS